MEKDSALPKTWMLVVLAVTAMGIAVLFFLAFSDYNAGREYRESYIQPKVITSLLEDLTAEDVDYSTVLQKYLVTSEVQAEIEGDTRAEGLGAIRDKLSFSYVFSQGIDDIAGYEVIQSRSGYVEFATLTPDGERNYPLIVLAYTLTEEGDKISDYSLGRLQPFSRRHPEYGEEWNT